MPINIRTAARMLKPKNHAASVAHSRQKSSIFHNRRRRAKTSRIGKRAIQLAGSAAKGSLDLDLVFLFLSSFPATAAWSLSR
jgi:hypothetical protein